MKLTLESLVMPNNDPLDGFVYPTLTFMIDSYRQGFRYFSRLVGRSDPWSKKWWVIFRNDGTKHIKLTTVDIWVVYFTYTLTQTHVCILTADYTVKPVLSDHSKKTNYRLMQVKIIAECSKGSILQSFRPSLSYHLFLRSLLCLFLSGCLRHVLLY